MSTKQISCRIPLELYRQLKMYVAQKGISSQELVIRLLTREMNPESELDHEIDGMLVTAKQKFAEADSLTLHLERAKFLGVGGAVSQLLQKLANVSPNERQVVGPRVNQLVNALEKAYLERLHVLGPPRATDGV